MAPDNAPIHSATRVDITVRLEPIPDGALMVYGQHTADGLPQAKMTSATVCGDCGGRFAEGHWIEVELAIPPADARWHHNDCDDPKLERVAD